MTFRKHMLAAIALALPLLAHPPALPAQEDDARRELAVKHFEKGVAFFDDENYGAALTEFLKSFEILPNPALRYNIGVCYYQTGKFVEALEQFQELLEKAGGKIKPALKKEIDDYVKKITGKIGTVEIQCSEPGAEVVIDKYYTYETPLEKPVPIVEGLHKIKIDKPGFEPFREEFSVSAGENKVIRAELQTTAPVKKPDAVEPLKDKASSKAGKGKKPVRWLWLAFGAGGALGAVAAVTGGLTLKKKSDMRDAESRCESTMSADDCPEAYDLQEEGRALMITSNVFIAAAAVAATTGLVLFLVERKKAGGEKQRPVKNTSLLWIAPSLAPGGRSGLGLSAGLTF